jgi:hypothetical protein
MAQRQRPDPSPSNFERTLLELGYTPKMASAIKSDFRLLVPMLIEHLGKERISSEIQEAQKIYLPNDTWLATTSTEAMVKWAEYELKKYKNQPS